MNLLSIILLSFTKADNVYVILGGSSATNNNNFTNYTSTNGVYSYDFKNSHWETAKNPMPGGQGNGSSIWPLLGDLLYKHNSSIYFYDCARLGANITDWGIGGKFYNTSINCFDLANKFIIDKNIEKFNVLWQEGPQDNVYSYNSNYFINTMENLIYRSGENAMWFISIYTYGYTYTNYRFDKAEDIIYLISNNNNVFLGANLDTDCIGLYPFTSVKLITISNLWYTSIINKIKTYDVYNIFYECFDIKFNFSDILLSVSIIFIAISLLCGGLYSYRYYQRRKEYIRLST